MTDLVVGVPVAGVWRSPAGPLPVDDPAVADLPDTAGWTTGMDQRTRLGLHGRLDTQALLGEPVEVVGSERGWAQVVLPWQPSGRDPRGYPGWVRRAHLADPLERSDHVAAVLATRTTARGTDGELTLSYGTILPVLDVRRDDVTVAAPGGAAVVDAGDVLIRQWADPDSRRWPAEALPRDARRFLGLRYLWGGLSAGGLDCSGLVHLTARVAGWTLPRDAADQHAALNQVDAAAAQPGDLYFFAPPGGAVNHVGFATSAPPHEPRTMLHAPEHSELVEDATMVPSRMATLVGAGRLPS